MCEVYEVIRGVHSSESLCLDVHKFEDVIKCKEMSKNGLYGKYKRYTYHVIALPLIYETLIGV